MWKCGGHVRTVLFPGPVCAGNYAVGDASDEVEHGFWGMEEEQRRGMRGNGTDGGQCQVVRRRDRDPTQQQNTKLCICLVSITTRPASLSTAVPALRPQQRRDGWCSDTRKAGKGPRRAGKGRNAAPILGMPTVLM